MKSGVAFNYTLTISQNPKNIIKQITWNVLHIGHIHGRSSSLENQTLSSQCFASCILTQSPPYKAERIKTIHNRPQFGKKNHTYLYIHRQMGSRPNLLPPFPSFLILCPICRGTGIKRLSIGRKGDGREVLQEPHEEERGFMVGELTFVRIVELAYRPL